MTAAPSPAAPSPAAPFPAAPFPAAPFPAAPDATPQVWRRTSTGFQVVETLLLPATPDRPEAWRVRRHPGRDRPHRPAPDPALAAELGRLDLPGARVTAASPHPGPGGAVEEFDVPSPLSVALMHHRLHERTRADLLAPLTALWTHVHARRAPAGLPVPSGASRVAGWLAGEARPRSADRLRRRLSKAAGPRRSARLATWVEEFARPRERTLLLGAVGTGSAYLGAGDAGTTFLVGGELAAGPAEWDLGWVLGELLERACTADPPARGLAGDAVAAVLVPAAGDPRYDRARVARASLLRWLVHLHDYASYVGWSEELADRVELLAGFVDDPVRLLEAA